LGSLVFLLEKGGLLNRESGAARLIKTDVKIGAASREGLGLVLSGKIIYSIIHKRRKGGRAWSQPIEHHQPATVSKTIF
jgi:hypothetical protein